MAWLCAGVHDALVLCPKKTSEKEEEDARSNWPRSRTGVSHVKIEASISQGRPPHNGQTYSTNRWWRYQTHIER